MDNKAAMSAFIAQVKAMPGNRVTVNGLTVTVVSPDRVTYDKVDDLLEVTGWVAVSGGNPQALTHGVRFMQ